MGVRILGVLLVCVKHIALVLVRCDVFSLLLYHQTVGHLEINLEPSVFLFKLVIFLLQLYNLLVQCMQLLLLLLLSFRARMCGGQW